MPFLTLKDEPDPPIELRQIGSKHFQLMTAFKYVDPTRESKAYIVPAHDAEGSTDLASVPWFLWWFIASYGHQTRAALLHDHLVGSDEVEREEADRVFRVALGESNVGFWRRWIMWCAVALATMRKRRFAPFILMVIQLIAGMALTVVSVWMLLTGGWKGLGPLGLPWLVWLAVPLVASFLWGKWWVIPSLGTYIGTLLLPATVVVLATVLVSSLPRFGRWVRGGFRPLPDGRGPIVVPYRRERF